MLAQNFMSAADLKLPEEVRDALITTLGMMERGEIRHTSISAEDETDDEQTFSGLFNLGIWAASFPCGTVACIGGTAELVGKLEPGRINILCDMTGMANLDDLCYPKHIREYGDITVEQAAKALRSYLTTGKPNWAEALSND